MVQRVVVFGAGGFIGSHLCGALARAGHEVIGFGRCPVPPDLPCSAWIAADFADGSAVRRALAGCSVAFHLVGSSTPALADADPQADLRDSLLSTLGFLDAARDAGVGRVVFASSGGTVYGRMQAPRVAETAPTEPLCAYGISKLAAEKYFALYGHLYGLDHCILRIGNVFGPGQTARRQQGVVAAFLGAAARGEALEVWGDGSVVRDYVFIDDVADALLRAARVPVLPHRVINIGSGVGRSIREVIGMVQRVAGCPSRVRHRPGRKVDVPAIVLDVGRAGAVLGWQPSTPWPEAMERTYRWYWEQARRPMLLEVPG